MRDARNHLIKTIAPCTTNIPSLRNFGPLLTTQDKIGKVELAI